MQFRKSTIETHMPGPMIINFFHHRQKKTASLLLFIFYEINLQATIKNTDTFVNKKTILQGTFGNGSPVNSL